MQQLQGVTENPGIEAEMLLAELLGKPRVYVLAHPEVALDVHPLEIYVSWIARRLSGEPLPYITGHVEFFGFEFSVSPAVLIPRPETEGLVEAALDWLATHPEATVVDVGAGSGCIAIALALRAPFVQIWATDISPDALVIARKNALHHGVEDRIHFLVGDLLEPLPVPPDLIVSNPPYVSEAEWPALPLSVRQEPPVALLGGRAGLDVIRRLLVQAVSRLRPEGCVLVEIGETQGSAVRTLACELFPGAQMAVLPDLAGKDRILRLALRYRGGSQPGNSRSRNRGA